MAGIEEAIHIAVEAHRGQVDKAGAPYIFHPLRLMLSMKTDAQRMAAVLHDTVEDTETSFEELEQAFGSAISNLVREVTDDKSLPKETRKQQQVDHAPHSSTPGAGRGSPLAKRKLSV